jgi:hypothetical protein
VLCVPTRGQAWPVVRARFSPPSTNRLIGTSRPGLVDEAQVNRDVRQPEPIQRALLQTGLQVPAGGLNAGTVVEDHHRRSRRLSQ